MIRKFFLILFALILSGFDADLLNDVRANYSKYASDKELCRKMMAELSQTKNSSSTHLAYFGSLKTIWASHVFSPISKFNTFREGKQNIEQAIYQEPENVELRFIRLSVQKNSPSFLGYNSNIREDTEFIRKNMHRINSILLTSNIIQLLKD